jgi:hypothetical protein
MPDWKRWIYAGAAGVLLAAMAGGQERSPFPQPRIMPPELMPEQSFRMSRPAVSPAAWSVELDNAQMRVMRFNLRAHARQPLPAKWSAGELLVAISDVELQMGTSTLRMGAGETKWIAADRPWVQNTGDRECEFLVVQPKRN